MMVFNHIHPRAGCITVCQEYIQQLPSVKISFEQIQYSLCNRNSLISLLLPIHIPQSEIRNRNPPPSVLSPQSSILWPPSSVLEPQ